MGALGGKIAVTGGAGGIGAACVAAIAEAGGEPVSFDLTANRECESHIVDVSDEAHMAPAFARIGALSGLICVAGTNAFGRVEDLSWDDWRRVLAVNVRGMMLALKHARLSDGAGIVLTSSVSAHIGCDGYTPYHCSKGAILGLMRATSGEFAPQGIRVNAVSPGWVDTPFTDRGLAALPDGEAVRAGAASAHILGRMAEPGEIAQAMIFLLSDKARFITGTELVVDGGFLRKK
jgi:NAD(P)-dependent dehydrogenase (short-subunit alcohol dehydrogenase family)